MSASLETTEKQEFMFTKDFTTKQTTKLDD